MLPNNNHFAGGSGRPKLMTQIMYCVTEKKLERIHHKFLAKKRNWLIRQIDPAKRYLFMMKKQEKMQEGFGSSKSSSDSEEDSKERRGSLI
jgi:hypothetical protein